MITALQGAADESRTMKARGVRLDPQSGAGGDLAALITDDTTVAEEFGFDAWEGEYDEEEIG